MYVQASVVQQNQRPQLEERKTADLLAVLQELHLILLFSSAFQVVWAV